MVDAPDVRVVVGEQRLYAIGDDRREGEDDGRRERDPGASSRDRDRDERECPQREHERVEQVDHHPGRFVDAVSTELREVVEQRFVARLEYGHELREHPREHQCSDQHRGEPQRRAGAGGASRPRGARARAQRIRGVGHQRTAYGRRLRPSEDSHRSATAVGGATARRPGPKHRSSSRRFSPQPGRSCARARSEPARSPTRGSGRWCASSERCPSR